MTNHNSMIISRVIMVSSLVDWMNDMGGPRGWKSMGHNVVKQVFYMDYYDFGILFEGFTF